MRYFASLDGNNTCTGTQSSDREVVAPNVIEVTNAVEIGIPLDDFMWRKYTGGAWSTEKYTPPTPAPGPDLVAEMNNLKSTQADILFAMVTNNLM